jgi:hypothetical protein
MFIVGQVVVSGAPMPHLLEDMKLPRSTGIGIGT